MFRRTDIGVDIPARFDRVVDTRLATVLADSDARIGTIEHVMAALAGCGIDNAVVEIDGPEPPILDGSASPFVFLLDCAGRRRAGRAANDDRDPPPGPGQRRRGIRRAAAAGSRHGGPGHGAVDRFSGRRDRTAGAVAPPDAGEFRHELARARTFTLAEEIDQLRAAGLARGGSLENAVVVDQARVLNPAGLRMPDEFVRHKLLDAVGDLALAGAPLRGRFVAHRSGHTLNNRLLQALFADRLGVAGDHAGAAFGRRRVVLPLRAATPHGISGAMEPIRPMPRFALVLVALLPLLGGCGGSKEADTDRHRGGGAGRGPVQQRHRCAERAAATTRRPTSSIWWSRTIRIRPGR